MVHHQCNYRRQLLALALVTVSTLTPSSLIYHSVAASLFPLKPAAAAAASSPHVYSPSHGGGPRCVNMPGCARLHSFIRSKTPRSPACGLPHLRRGQLFSTWPQLQSRVGTYACSSSSRLLLSTSKQTPPATSLTLTAAPREHDAAAGARRRR